MALPGGEPDARWSTPRCRCRRAASSTARASRTTRRSSRGWPSGTRCSATRRQTLRAVRDPQRLASALRDAGLPYPRTFAAAPDDRSGRWLRKPLRGGGGTRVREWRGGALPAGDGRAGAHRRGRVLGGGGRRRGGRGRARAHRAARRAPRVRRARLPLVRERRPAAAAGGERDACSEQARAICSRLAAAFASARAVRRRLRLGRRARVDDRGQPAPDGVARGDRGGVRRRACSTRTCAACAGELPRVEAEPAGAAGKAVLFATEDVIVGDSVRWLERGVRDVPHPGERIAAGRPICTVRGDGRDAGRGAGRRSRSRPRGCARSWRVEVAAGG